MILNLLKLAGVAIGVMAVVLAIGYLYVMNEMREEIKKDRGVRMKKMIWAGMNPPNGADERWASENNGFLLGWNMKVRNPANQGSQSKQQNGNWLTAWMPDRDQFAPGCPGFGKGGGSVKKIKFKDGTKKTLPTCAVPTCAMPT